MLLHPPLTTPEIEGEPPPSPGRGGKGGEKSPSLTREGSCSSFNQQNAREKGRRQKVIKIIALGKKFSWPDELKESSFAHKRGSYFTKKHPKDYLI